MEYDLGEVSSQGEARRRSPEWARAQDESVEDAASFLRSRVPGCQQIVSVKERVGTIWIVNRGSAPADLNTGAAFRKKYGSRASFRVLADSEEYRLELASPSEAWRMGRGKTYCLLYLFLASDLLGAMLMFRPEVLFEALPLLE